jgi:hypothetical protein
MDHIPRTKRHWVVSLKWSRFYSVAFCPISANRDGMIRIFIPEVTMAGIDLKELAKRGAEVRIQELQAERAVIYKAFPDLRSRSAMGPRRGSEIGSGRITA